jgi:Tfp pilus assembly protein PilF
MADILHRVGIKSSTDEVYKALTTREGLAAWWTNNTQGESKVGGVITFRFSVDGSEIGFFDMKILELHPAERVLWQVVDGPKEWIGTKISWDLKQESDYAIVLLKHQGWKEPVEFMHREARGAGEVAASKAIALDSSLPEAHRVRASQLAHEMKLVEAESEFRRALQLNPKDAVAHYMYAFACLHPQKRFDQALEEFRIALALDPLSPIMNVNYAVTFMSVHQYPEALAQFRKAAGIAPSFEPVHMKAAELHAAMGNVEEAIREWKQFDPKAVSDGTSQKALGEMMAATFLARRRAGYWPASYIASGYAVAGDRQRTFEWLNQSLEDGDPQFSELIRYPVFDSIRSDVRFAELVRKAGLPQ